MNKKNNGMMKNALYYVLVILAMVMVVYFIFGNNGQRSSDIEYSKFTEQLQAGKIKEFEVQPANGVYKISYLGFNRYDYYPFHNNHFAK